MDKLFFMGWAMLVIASIYSANDKHKPGKIFSILALMVFVTDLIIEIIEMVVI